MCLIATNIIFSNWRITRILNEHSQFLIYSAINFNRIKKYSLKYFGIQYTAIYVEQIYDKINVKSIKKIIKLVVRWNSLICSASSRMMRELRITEAFKSAPVCCLVARPQPDKPC